MRGDEKLDRPTREALERRHGEFIHAVFGDPSAGRPPTGRYPTAKPIAADLQNALQMLRMAKQEPDAATREQLIEGAEERVKRAVEKLREFGVLL